MLTLKEIVEERIPDELKVPRSEITDDTGSDFSKDTVAEIVDTVNQEVAERSNLIMNRDLQDSVIITLSAAEQAEWVAEADLPERCHIPIILDAVDSSDNERRLARIWFRREEDYYFMKDGYGSYYDIRGRQVRIGPNPPYTTHRLIFQRTPGRLFYGTTASASTTSHVATVTAGRISNIDDAYIGDRLIWTASDGSVEVKRITDFDASSKTFTTEAFSTTPTSGDVISIASFLPAAYIDLLVYGAAGRMSQVPERASVSASRFESTLARFLDSISPYEIGSSKQPRQTKAPFAYSTEMGNGRLPYGRLA